MTHPVINRLGKSIYWNHFSLKNAYNFNNKFILIKLSFIINFFFKYGLNISVFENYMNFFWINLFNKKKIFNIQKLTFFKLIKVRVQINKKSFNTFFRRQKNKFLNPFNLILFTFKNILVLFMFFFKPKKIHINFSGFEYNKYIKNKKIYFDRFLPNNNVYTF